MLSLREVKASQAAILGAVMVFAFGNIASYYSCLLILFCLWDEMPVAKLESTVRSVVLLAILGVSAAMVVASSAAAPTHDKQVYLSASLACLVASSILFWDLLGIPDRISQLAATLDRAMRIPSARKWGIPA